ncbi:glycosyltransferase [Flavobacterium sp. SM15]|uniref:glycosyltransferase n=1 Tax=Flavobacterium sp. SM15 TaxID=2908005 RepID=UPI001EDC3D86|nr:glycosyltransferase [Flavobacterium sp. SM15]MCG2611004.1 glycosyltransferase [Flavobacterium sp. SM15]
MTIQGKRPKIALIGYRLSGGGGDRVMANLSLFFDAQGFEVHNIIVIDEVTFPYVGKLLNLGLLKDQSNGFLNKWKRLKAIKDYLDHNQFDYIIDFRFRVKPIQELLLARWVYKTKTIFTVHSFLIDHYMPNNSWFTRLMYGSSLANVAITNQIKELIEQKHKLKNVLTIYNPIPIEEIQQKASEEITIDNQYIVAVGQFETRIKQFDVLIDCYSKSVLPNKNIHLIIIGDGDLKPKLLQQVKELQLTDFVNLIGYESNPFKYLKNAKFTVLSSANEGLPMVLLESLACGTPVVAFDCDSGPREIIADKVNGLLVENQNKEKLTEAMDLMVTDEKLYVNCKQNALGSIRKFSLESIGRQWLDLMNIK